MSDKTRQDILDGIGLEAYAYEQSYGNCPQCVLAPVLEGLGSFDDAVFKASYALSVGGGLSSRGTCGALVGGLMAIGAMYGRDIDNIDKSYRHVYLIGRRLLDRFVAHYGTLICGEIQTQLMGRSFDVVNPEEYKAFLAAGGHTDKCPNVVRNAAIWTAEILLEVAEAGNQS